MPTLFDPIKIGDLELNNRIIMAPLTRCRAEPGRVPGDLIAEYYAQRADAGLIISEATSVTPMGVGYPDTPGIWSAEQVQGWKKVTDAVHAKGGKIVLQLWHVGRISDPLYLDGQLPVAPSALKPAGHVSLVRPKKDYETPRALEIDEIPGIIEAYRRGGECQGSRFRRCRDPWRQRLSARSVPAGQHQQAHRRLRWLTGKPCTTAAGSDRCRRLRMGRRARRSASGAARRLP